MRDWMGKTKVSSAGATLFANFARLSWAGKAWEGFVMADIEKGAAIRRLQLDQKMRRS